MTTEQSEKSKLLSPHNPSVQNVTKSRFSQQLAYDTFDAHVTKINAVKKKDAFTNTFLRKTTKFWVLPSNFLTVKKRINKRIPEWTFNNKKSENLQNSGSIINSVYLDTENLDLYKYRILQVDSSMLFRYRWYSNNKANKGFMEQKIRRPGWRGEANIKQRFDLNSNIVPDYIKKGPSVVPLQEKIVDEMFQDMNSWGELTPFIRSTYRRTVFQEANTAPVRISFDEDVTLSNIHNLTWDECVDPSHPLPSYKLFEFPLGILEVKLSFEQTEEIQYLELPDWIVDMQNNGLIIQVEKFSKYCTGACIMNLNTITKVPSWIAAVKTLMEIELARRGREWFGSEKNPQWEIIAEKAPRVPAKVEPREYLANERTLLKWVRMCFLALFVGLALLGFQHEPITGIILTLFALFILFRAYYMYRVRLKMLMEKKFTVQFYDPWGPPMIIILFVVPAITYLCYCFGVFKVGI